MSAVGLSQRRRSAYAARMEAKRRRQKVMVIVGAVVLVALFAYEIPHTLHLVRGSSNGSPAAAPTTPTAAAPAPPQRIPKSLHSSGDPFVVKSLPNGDPGIGPETAGHDPFAQPSVAATPAPAAASTPLPGTIVLGTPGGSRHATHGWIVILASIPTGEGRAAAERFAGHAKNVGSLQILNSSNRRPLRGGYWVVYTGPYTTLAQVSQRAASVHAAGYGSAYIRELIVYR